jgi:hypothetical protein
MSFPRPLLIALVASVIVVGCGVNSRPVPGSAAAPAPAPPKSGTLLFSDSFNRPDGLITNEYAFWNPTLADSVSSRDWEMTSGSFFTRGGSGWSGVPDDRSPNAKSTTGTDSSVFRLTTKRADFDNVGVAFDLRITGLSETPTTPPVDWDGIHVFLRYQNEQSLYYASVDRRDGTTAIKKKVPGGPSNGGTYYQLASGHHVVPFGAWDHVRATIADSAGGSVTIKLYVGDKLVSSAVDKGTGGPPITHPGKVGIRGDNANFDVDGFSVTAL